MQGVCQMARFGNSWSVANLAIDYIIKYISNNTL